MIQITHNKKMPLYIIILMSFLKSPPKQENMNKIMQPIIEQEASSYKEIKDIVYFNTLAIDNINNFFTNIMTMSF